MMIPSEPFPTQDSSAEEGGEARASCVDIVEEDERWREIPGLYALIEAVAAETLQAGGRDPSRYFVAVGLFADADIRALNKEFREKDQPTNVLSFPAAEMPNPFGEADEPLFLGDVALGFETVSAEASSEQKSLAHHTAHLVTHGILHLLGFDHEGDKDAEQMEQVERQVLTKFGIADPYRASTTATN